jgi:hypothetical protein
MRVRNVSLLVLGAFIFLNTQSARADNPFVALYLEFFGDSTEGPKNPPRGDKGFVASDPQISPVAPRNQRPMKPPRKLGRYSLGDTKRGPRASYEKQLKTKDPFRREVSGHREIESPAEIRSVLNTIKMHLQIVKDCAHKANKREDDQHNRYSHMRVARANIHKLKEIKDIATIMKKENSARTKEEIETGANEKERSVPQVELKEYEQWAAELDTKLAAVGPAPAKPFFCEVSQAEVGAQGNSEPAKPAPKPPLPRPRTLTRVVSYLPLRA